MSETPRGKAQGPMSEVAVPMSYEPPRMVAFGNLRDLLGKSGGKGDTSTMTAPMDKFTRRK
jgi:hypothetical protein